MKASTKVYGHNKTAIYVLSDDAGNIRYVGKTRYLVHIRLRGHLLDAKRGGGAYRGHWVRSLLRRGDAPRMTLVGVVDGNGDAEEKAYISYFRDEGMRLVNTTAGGNGPYCFSMPAESVKRRADKLRGSTITGQALENIRAAARRRVGVPQSPSTIEKRVSKIRGRKRPEWVLDKISAAQRGKHSGPHSEAHNAAISKALSGRTLSALHRQHISEAHRRRIITDEERRKIRERFLGKKLTEDHRRALSASHMGHVMSQDTRARLSASHKTPAYLERWRAARGFLQPEKAGAA